MLVLLGDAQVVAGVAPGSVLQGEVAGIARAGPGLDDLIVPQQLHGDGVGAQNAALDGDGGVADGLDLAAHGGRVDLQGDQNAGAGGAVGQAVIDGVPHVLPLEGGDEGGHNAALHAVLGLVGVAAGGEAHPVAPGQGVLHAAPLHLLDVLGELGAGLKGLEGGVAGVDLHGALHLGIVEVPVGGGAHHHPVRGGVVGDAEGLVGADAVVEVGGGHAALVAGAENLALVAPVVYVLVAVVVLVLVGSPLVGQKAGQLAVLVHQAAVGAQQLPLGLGRPVGVAVVVGEGGEVQTGLVPGPVIVLVHLAHAVGQAALAVDVAKVDGQVPVAVFVQPGAHHVGGVLVQALVGVGGDGLGEVAGGRHIVGLLGQLGGGEVVVDHLGVALHVAVLEAKLPHQMDGVVLIHQQLGMDAAVAVAVGHQHRTAPGLAAPAGAHQHVVLAAGVGHGLKAGGVGGHVEIQIPVHALLEALGIDRGQGAVPDGEVGGADGVDGHIAVVVPAHHGAVGLGGDPRGGGPVLALADHNLLTPARGGARPGKELVLLAVKAVVGHVEVAVAALGRAGPVGLAHHGHGLGRAGAGLGQGAQHGGRAALVLLRPDDVQLALPGEQAGEEQGLAGGDGEHLAPLAVPIAAGQDAPVLPGVLAPGVPDGAAVGQNDGVEHLAAVGDLPLPNHLIPAAAGGHQAVVAIHKALPAQIDVGTIQRDAGELGVLPIEIGNDSVVLNLFHNTSTSAFYSSSYLPTPAGGLMCLTPKASTSRVTM